MTQPQTGRSARSWNYHPLEIVVRPGAAVSTLACDLVDELSKSRSVGFVRHGASVEPSAPTGAADCEIQVNGQRSQFLRQGHLDLPLQRALLVDADLVVVEGRLESCGPPVHELGPDASRDLSTLGLGPDDVLCGLRRSVEGVPPGGIPWFEASDLPELVDHLLEILERRLRARPLWGLAFLRRPAGHPDSVACLQNLSNVCERVLVASSDSVSGFEDAPDLHRGLSDLGRILSSLETHPESAFLVADADAADCSDAAIHQLIQFRDPFRAATALREPDKHLPQRFPSLWEPKSRQRIHHALAADIRCVQRILTHSRIQLLDPIGLS